MALPHKIIVYRDSSGKRWRYRVKAKKAWPDGVVEVQS